MTAQTVYSCDACGSTRYPDAPLFEVVVQGGDDPNLIMHACRADHARALVEPLIDALPMAELGVVARVMIRRLP